MLVKKIVRALLLGACLGAAAVAAAQDATVPTLPEPSSAPDAQQDPAAGATAPAVQRPAPPPAPQRSFEAMPVVVLQGLDKVTARTSTFEAKVGDVVQFGQLSIEVKSCRKAPPIDPPESAAFLDISEIPTTAGAAPVPVFVGWMFASSPALSAMEHPVYDIWVKDCKKSETKARSSSKQ
ncbi:DUF2155 domain-containing protein [Niveispirillum sp. SYP-B3756]|uniref:DUF2155 domain-containing protein n=1 Tax=Niveispirillum sp. SYP-B3756 TaxID=2662178 RepID=UPI001FFFEC82|nr:DUF2155 domain-containing protein [Niveispirillum sp. SYP-B3756]